MSLSYETQLQCIDRLPRFSSLENKWCPTYISEFRLMCSSNQSLECLSSLHHEEVICALCRLTFNNLMIPICTFKTSWDNNLSGSRVVFIINSIEALCDTVQSGNNYMTALCRISEKSWKNRSLSQEVMQGSIPLCVRTHFLVLSRVGEGIQSLLVRISLTFYPHYHKRTHRWKNKTCQ